MSRRSASTRKGHSARIARRSGRPTVEFLQIYALEGFLSRLGTSPHGNLLVLKGGVLLAAFDTRRPTRA